MRACSRQVLSADGKNVLLPIERCGSTAVACAMLRRMGIPLLTPAVENLGQTVSLTHESWNLWRHKIPKDAIAWVIGRHPVERFRSASRVFRVLWEDAANYERMLAMAPVTTERHLMPVSRMLPRLAGFQEVRFLQIEKVSEWESQFGITVLPLNRDQLPDALEMAPEVEARVRKIYQEDFQLFGYES